MIDLDDLLAPYNTAPMPWQQERDWGSRVPVEMSPDLRRVRDLERRERPGAVRLEAMIELMTRRHGRGPRGCACARIVEEREQPPRPCIERLRPAQAWALYEMGLVKGLVGMIGVGHGKTLIDFLGVMALGVDLALLLVPASLVDQLVDEYELVAEHFKVPSLIVHGRDFTAIQRGRPALHAMSYSRLSRPDATTFLEELKPAAILCDEFQKIRDLTSTRTMRLRRYYREHPETLWAGWTGSTTDKSIRDYAHLAALALRQGSPLPLSSEVVEDWASALDPVDSPAPGGALIDELCEPGEHVRSGFRRRLTETLGVVTTEEPAVDVELVIEEREAPELPHTIETYLTDVREDWVRPDGEELVSALDVARCCRELAAGFYYRWIFPRGEPVPLVLEWLDARSHWHRELRREVLRGRPRMDSPKLCSMAAWRYYNRDKWEDDTADPKPVWDAEHWVRWAEVRDKVVPETETVRVDDFLVRDAAAWARENVGIVWYESRAFGEWLAEVTELPLYGGGKKSAQQIVKERGQRSIIASVKSHGTGRDGLQRVFDHQLVAQPPSSSTAWEQLLGRLHRVGQQSARVLTELYRHTPEVRAAVDQAMMRAEYVEATIGARQKLRAGWRGNSAAPDRVLAL